MKHTDTLIKHARCSVHECVMTLLIYSGYKWYIVCVYKNMSLFYALH